MQRFAAKLSIVVGLVLALVFALSAVRGVIDDRLRYRAEALASVGESLAGPQRLAGVVLVQPFIERRSEEQIGEDRVRRSVQRAVQRQVVTLPDALSAEGTLALDPRRRGLFRVNGYVWTGTLHARLRMPDPAALPHARDGSTLETLPARLALIVSDVRGIRAVTLALAGRALEAQPGSGFGSGRPGVSAPLAAGIAPGTTLEVESRLTLGGAERFEFVPLGADSRLTLASPWPHPSFSGRFLPLERRVAADGFSARWQTSAFASNAREAWLTAGDAAASVTPDGAAAAAAAATGAAARDADLDTFRVALIDPVDIYSLSDRATKYALLFVALTLGGFALFETLRRLRVHPLQYLLVGTALVLFFLLLLAVAEHLGFGLAYLIASGACVALLGAYVGGALASARRGAAFAAALAALYAALYGIVESEQNALLLGTLLVFGLLATVMIATRRVDWTALFESRGDAAGEGA